MAVGQSLLESQLPDGKAGTVSNRATSDGAQNVNARSVEELLEETNRLLRLLVIMFQEVHADDLTSLESEDEQENSDS